MPASGTQLPRNLTRNWGGKRAGAGRPRGPGRPRVEHGARPGHRKDQPVHVTMRALPDVKSLRHRRVFPAVRGALAASEKDTFRVVHFSVQADHIHMLVEGSDRRSLRSGVQGVAVRVARAVNKALARTGRVWGDRYHARALRTPTETRNALIYILNNIHKHAREFAPGLDACSSARWFDGWRGLRTRPPREDPPVARPHTWLVREGWRRAGKTIPIDAMPARSCQRSAPARPTLTALA